MQQTNSVLIAHGWVLRLNAHVAQSAEHILGKDEVTGSIPVMGSSIDRLYVGRVGSTRIEKALPYIGRRRYGKGKI